MLSKLDKEMLPNAVGCGEDPTGSDEGAAAEHLSVFVQDGHLPRPAALGCFSATYKQKNMINILVKRLIFVHLT